MIHKQLDYRLYLLFYYNFKDTLTLLDQRNIPPDPWEIRLKHVRSRKAMIFEWKKYN